MFSAFKEVDNDWKEIKTRLDQMIYNLDGVLEESCIKDLKKILTLDDPNKSIKNIIFDLIDIVNKMAINVNAEKEKKKNQNINPLPNLGTSIQVFKKTKSQKVRSNFDEIPQKMLRTVCNFLPFYWFFLWKFGTVNRKILYHAENIMSQNKLLVHFAKNEQKQEEMFQQLKASGHIAKSVERIGLAASINEYIARKSLSTITKFRKFCFWN